MWMMSGRCSAVLLMLLVTMGALALDDPYEGLDATAIRARSVVDIGQAGRVQPALMKARRGEKVVIGAIGGSITEGAVSSKPKFRWANRVAQWWIDTFPQAEIEFVNAGIGATGSDIGAHRVKRDLLKDKPDFVLVEFAVNDNGKPAPDETLEGLLRQILTLPNNPGAMMLFTMTNKGVNVQDKHIPVGKHYGLPMVSYRDAMCPEVESGHIAWEAFSGDYVHPNDRGHAICADLLIQVLEQWLADLPEETIPKAEALPEPLISDVFERTVLRNRDNLSPARNDGWKSIPGSRYGRGWAADAPGSVLEFDVEGTAVGLIFWRVKGPMGIAEAQVDDAPPVRLEAWFNADWGGYNPFTMIARDLDPGMHRLRVTVLDEKQPGSEGHRFEVHGVACAGAYGKPVAPLRVADEGIMRRDGKPYRGFGVNYFSAFYRALKNPDDTSYDAGFAQLAQRGIPFARFMASGFWPVDYRLYQEDKAKHFALLDAMVASAEKHGVGLIPSLAWYDGCIPDLVGEPRNAWGDPESKTLQFLRQYATEVVTRYVDSPAIWAWELGNEWSLAADLPNAADWRPKIVPRLGTATERSAADDLATDMLLVAFKEFGRAVRAIDPVRPITTGNSIPRQHAEHMRKGAQGRDTREDYRANLILRSPVPNDMLSIHYYPQSQTPRFGEDKTSLTEVLALSVDAARTENKALLIGEFGVSADAFAGDAGEIRARFSATLEEIVQSDAALAALWVFDHGGQDATWNIRANNHRAWMLDAVAEANKRLVKLGF
jgi:lysophospholipase L1-like esterase